MAKPFRARQPFGCEVPFVVFTRDRSESGVSGVENRRARPCGARLDVRIAPQKRRRRSLRVKTGKSSSFSLQKLFTLRCTMMNILSNTIDLLHFQLASRVYQKRKFCAKNRRKKYLVWFCWRVVSVNFIPHLFGKNIGGNVRRFTAKETKRKPVKTCTFVVLYLFILCSECLLPDVQ